MLIILPRISLAVAKGFDMILVRSVSITRCQGVVSEVWTQRRMIFSSSSVDSLIELNCRIWPQAPATLGNVQLHRPRILCKGSLKRFLSTTVNKEIASLFAVLFYKFKRDFRRPIKNSCRFFFCWNYAIAFKILSGKLRIVGIPPAYKCDFKMSQVCC